MYQRQVSFTEAVKRTLTVNYCNFNGRSSRSEYWWYALAMLILNVVLTLITGHHETASAVISTIVGLALLLPGLGLAVRRMHDINKSGWWILINLIPVVGNIIFIIFACKDSDPERRHCSPLPDNSEREMHAGHSGSAGHRETGVDFITAGKEIFSAGP